MENETPLGKFRNSVGFQFNFVFYSGLEPEEAIDNICGGAEAFAKTQNQDLRDEIEKLETLFLWEAGELSEGQAMGKLGLNRLQLRELRVNLIESQK